MLFRSNPCRIYAPCFEFRGQGLLLITRKWIIATGLNARVWAW
jgi:hypothetical protein